MVKLTVYLQLGLLLTMGSAMASAREISVSERMTQLREKVHGRVKPYFSRQRVAYPPDKMALVVIKDEARMKLYAKDEDGGWRYILQYQVAKMSGNPGPKLRAGDLQVPEGVYYVTHLNPNSKFWLSLAINYPNAFDRSRAREDDRTKLGGDIMLHGWWYSEGCVALGNTAIEDIFAMTQEVGIGNVSVIISPTDFRHDSEPSKLPTKPKWTKQLYANLEEELNRFGSDGMTTDTLLVSYPDIAPPPPPTPKTIFEKLLRALADAAATSSTKQNKLK